MQSRYRSAIRMSPAAAQARRSGQSRQARLRPRLNAGQDDRRLARAVRHQPLQSEDGRRAQSDEPVICALNASTPKTREIAIMTVAREMDSRFEWAAHEPEALKEGVAGGHHRHHQTPQEHAGARRKDRRHHRIRPADFSAITGCRRRPTRGCRALFEPNKLVELVHTHGQLRRHRRAPLRLRHAGAGGQADVAGGPIPEREPEPRNACATRSLVGLFKPHSPQRAFTASISSAPARPSAGSARRRDRDRGRSRD